MSSATVKSCLFAGTHHINYFIQFFRIYERNMENIQTTLVLKLNIGSSLITRNVLVRCHGTQIATLQWT
jgi:hypothetical protein